MSGHLPSSIIVVLAHEFELVDFVVVVVDVVVVVVVLIHCHWTSSILGYPGQA